MNLKLFLQLRKSWLLCMSYVVESLNIAIIYDRQTKNNPNRGDKHMRWKPFISSNYTFLGAKKRFR